MTAWWRKKTQLDSTAAPVVNREPIRVGRATMPDDAHVGYDREQWTFPCDDLSWSGAEQSAESPPGVPACVTAAAQTCIR